MEGLRSDSERGKGREVTKRIDGSRQEAGGTGTRVHTAERNRAEWEPVEDEAECRCGMCGRCVCRAREHASCIQASPADLGRR